MKFNLNKYKVKLKKSNLFGLQITNKIEVNPDCIIIHFGIYYMLLVKKKNKKLFIHIKNQLTGEN